MKKLLFLTLLFTTTLIFAQDEVIRNGEFDNGKTGWVLRDYSPADMSYEIKEDSMMSGANYLSMMINKGGEEIGDVILYQSNTFEPGYIYTLTFIASASKEHTINVDLQQSSGDKANKWSSGPLALTTENQTFGPFVYKKYDYSESTKLLFSMGLGDSVTINFDAISITKVDDPDHIRDGEKFEYRNHTFEETTIPYRLARPESEPDENGLYPLVLALHGSGERGSDNELPISVHRLAFAWSDSANQKDYPCYVAVPQCPLDNRWVDSDWSTGTFTLDDYPISNELETVNNMIDSLIAEFPIDTNRLYITGLSMGGYGTWYMIQKFPHRFAAAAPMSGGGDPAMVTRVKHIPLWVFHGENDGTVPPSGSRDMITALENMGYPCVYTHCDGAGGCTGLTPEEIDAEIAAGAKRLYTEWEGKGHVMWAESFDFPQFIPWIFSQNKANNTGVKDDLKPILDFALAQNYPNPFNPSTTIQYVIPTQSHIELSIYNVLGKKVATLVNQTQAAGAYSVNWNSVNNNNQRVPSGVYFYELKSGDHRLINKMTLLK